MPTVRILTPWAGTGTERDPHRPAFHDDYPGVKWEDVSGHYAHQNRGPFVIEVTADEATIDRLVNDPRYPLEGQIADVPQITTRRRCERGN